LKLVLVVDDDYTQLAIAESALKNDYRVELKEGAAQALGFLENTEKLPDVILLDMDMPKINGYEMLSYLKKDERFAEIPVMFVSGNEDDATELEVYNAGAVDFIHKPYSVALLKKKVDIQIEANWVKENQKRKIKMLDEFNEQMQDFNVQTQEDLNRQSMRIEGVESFVLGLLYDIETARLPSLGIHALRVAGYTSALLDAIGKETTLKISEEDRKSILFAAQIHDIGKLMLPDDIITGDENSLFGNSLSRYLNHTVSSSMMIYRYSQYIKETNFISLAFQVCRHHHERWDGSGYPEHLAGNMIPQAARIVAVANDYDNYVYRNGIAHEMACQVIESGAGRQYDPKVVMAFSLCKDQFLKIGVVYSNNR